MVEIESTDALPPWADVYEQHSLRLVRLATLLAGPHDAHDLVTDAVMRAVSSEAWPTVTQPGAYLARTLMNLADDRRRSDLRRRSREQRVQGMAQAAPLPDVEAMMVVRSALDVLTPPQMAVVYLHYWEDLTLQQAAEQLGMRVGTARTHFDRAKRMLRVALAREQRR